MLIEEIYKCVVYVYDTQIYNLKSFVKEFLTLTLEYQWYISIFSVFMVKIMKASWTIPLEWIINGAR